LFLHVELLQYALNEGKWHLMGRANGILWEGQMASYGKRFGWGK